MIIPTEGDAIEMTPDSGFLIPFWYHMQSDNECMSGCEFDIGRKPLCKTGSECGYDGSGSIEQDLEKYIADNVPSCISGFSELEKTGMEVTENDVPQAKVTVLDGRITVDLDYPLEIEEDGVVNNVDLFRVSSPSLLKDFYVAAAEISEYSASNCFLENHMINIISLYSGLGTDLPPYSASTRDLGDVIWIKTEVKDKLSELSYSFIPQIRFGGTLTNPYPEVESEGIRELDQGISDQFVFFPFDDFKNMKVTASYLPWWEPYVDVKPSRGEIIGPSEITDFKGNFLSKLMGPIVMKEYEFAYRYSFPAVIELRARDIYDREKTFRFALEANIRANKCFHPGSAITSDSGEQSLLCNEEFFTEGEKEFIVTNKVSGEDIEQAEIFFYSGETCRLGTTATDGKLSTGIPSSTGGFFKIEKSGYQSQFLELSEAEDKNFIKLQPIYTKDVKIAIFNHTDYLNRSEDNIIDYYEPEPDDTIIISLTRIKDSYKDPEFTAQVSYMNGEILTDGLELIPGKYEMDALIMKRRNITLVEEKDRICEPFLGVTGNCIKTPISDTCFPRGTPDDDRVQEDWEESDCYEDGYVCKSVVGAIKNGSSAVPSGLYFTCTAPGVGLLPTCILRECSVDEEILIPETEMTAFMNGGAFFNETNLYWRVSQTQLENHDSVQFRLVRQKVPVRHHELRDAMIYREWSMEYPGLFKPIFG
jgi:hypothetical protein